MSEFWKHFTYGPVGNHASSPTMHGRIIDEFELGLRVALSLEDEEIWGASTQIMFWDGHMKGII